MCLRRAALNHRADFCPLEASASSRLEARPCTVERERVLGIDACKPGWIGVTLDDGGTSAYFSTQVSDLAGQAQADGPILVVAIDMPIGLPDRGRRAADVLARAAVGPLRSSVFMTPVRAALEADDHRSAVAVNRKLAGEGISVQAFGLKTKLFQVESWVREAGYRVVEVHPEVCFAQLAGAPLSLRKATWAGAERRRDLLAHAGVTLAGDLGVAGRAAAVDDVLDAAVAAWTARRVARGEARSMPDPPEAFTDGLPCAIWA
jgi:predicted RNase H-like nuclease